MRSLPRGIPHHVHPPSSPTYFRAGLRKYQTPHLMQSPWGLVSLSGRGAAVQFLAHPASTSTNLCLNLYPSEVPAFLGGAFETHRPPLSLPDPLKGRCWGPSGWAATLVKQGDCKQKSSGNPEEESRKAAWSRLYLSLDRESKEVTKDKCFRQ